MRLQFKKSNSLYNIQHFSHIYSVKLATRVTISTMLTSTIFWALLAHIVGSQNYTADWASLDSRPLPQWFEEAKFGIFIQWGVFSVPAYVTDSFWHYLRHYKEKNFLDFMAKNYPPGFTYEQFAPMFTAEYFDPVIWTEMLANSGAKFVMVNAKFLDGFAMWDSEYSGNWTSFKTGPKRDLTGELAKAIRQKNDLRFGVYYSLSEWFHPLYLKDSLSNSTEYIDRKLKPEMTSLVEKFTPDILWVDGVTEKPEGYWHSREFLAWLYNNSPVKDTVVANDYWEFVTPCKHGDFQGCEGTATYSFAEQHRKWVNTLKIDSRTFGYRRNANLSEYVTTETIISTLVETVSCGGNLRLAISATHDGRFPLICQERLFQIGNWLKINGEAIFKSKPWHVRNNADNDNGIWYTQVDCTVYAMILSWPINSNDLLLNAPQPTNCTTVRFLQTDKKIKYKPGNDSQGMTVRLPLLTSMPHLRTQPAWVLSLGNLKNAGSHCV